MDQNLEIYKKYYHGKAKPRVGVGEQVLILLPADNNKLLMQWGGPFNVESLVGANDYRIKMRSETKMYHLNLLKKYIVRKLKVEVVHTSNKDDTTIAVAGVIYQDTNPELGEVPDLEGYHQKEGVQDVKLGEDLSNTSSTLMYLQICWEKLM